MDKQFVYSFNEGSKDMRSLLGGKGANLAEMTKIGLPVPFGFTVTTEACKQYYKDGKKIDESIIEEILQKLEDLENVMGKKLGDPSDPLLVSVRSGAPISMPGMMDTVLNLGLNDETVEALGRLTENDRFAYDSYRRFLQMFGDVVYEQHFCSLCRDLITVVRGNASLWRHKRRIGEDNVVSIIPFFEAGQGIVFADVRIRYRRYRSRLHARFRYLQQAENTARLPRYRLGDNAGACHRRSVLRRLDIYDRRSRKVPASQEGG